MGVQRRVSILHQMSLGRQMESGPMRDESEGEVGFQDNTSRRRDGMWGLPSTGARSRETEPGI